MTGDRPPYFDMLTLTGEDLDRLAYDLFGFERPKGQTDADFRDRILRQLKLPRCENVQIGGSEKETDPETLQTIERVTRQYRYYSSLNKDKLQ